MIRVMFVDDHEMVVAGLAAVLGDEPDLEIVAVAATLAVAMDVISTARPDVVVMDYRLPDGDGVEGTRRVRQLDPTVNVIMLSATSDDRVLSEALTAGCCGFLTKGDSVDNLAHAVRSAAHGDGVFSADVVARLARLSRPGPDRSVGSSQTERELEVLRGLAAGRGTPAMARQLGLSEHTVRNHVRNILNKLDAHTKLEAVVTAARNGLVDVSA